MIAIRIKSEEDETSHDQVYDIACGNCKLRRESRYQTKRDDIDVYNTFVDDFAKAGA